MRRPVPQALRRPGLSLTAVAGLALAAAGLATAPAAFARPAVPAAYDSGTAAAQAACAAPAAGHASCGVLEITGGAHAAVRSPATTPPGLGPTDLRSAYALPANGGTGVTVAVVDAYDDPNAAADMAVYRTQYGLPACTVANGCFSKVGQTGSTTQLPSADSGWAEEASADLDMVSAVAPDAHIVLVEANSADMTDLGASVNEAVTLGAKSVDMAWGGSESSSDSTEDTEYFDHPGVAESSPAGDEGEGLEFPGSSRYVTAIGGTTLTAAPATKRGWTESAYGSGGCSTTESKPSWQKDAFCTTRTAVDVSAVADATSGLAVYDTYGGVGGWQEFEGTALSSGIITGVYADAGAPAPGSSPSSFPYGDPSALNDITTGTGAGPGYDEPTGMGTPNGVNAFKELTTGSPEG